ncbi:hypothetical protein [Pseudovibrio exalbescens]|uniref:Uncharacterized protein n=1 Tax=Pseudovibrio exalbescens TaxID=197461 RepID=A0A1U7JD37_9HYPH|nr:hypothetical protein [Pseudovibrio exalbescens]OKL42608.1 hypothetical protein A3843_18320 [Pseudovibrio exalbescens]
MSRSGALWDTLLSFLRLGQPLNRPVRILSRRLDPFLADTRRRFGESSQIFYRPFMIGFLGSVIDGMARDVARTSDPNLIGAMQVRVWQQITGLSDASIGDLMSQESLRQSQGFLRGWDLGDRFRKVFEDPNTFSLWYDLAQLEGDGENDDSIRIALSDVFETPSQEKLTKYDPRVLAAWRLSLQQGLY